MQRFKNKVKCNTHVFTVYKPSISNIRCATSRTVPGSIPGGVIWDFYRGSFRQSLVPWGRISLWKWVPEISPVVKVAGAFGRRPTTLVVPKVEEIRGLNLPETPRATSACRGIPLLYFVSNITLISIVSKSTNTSPMFLGSGFHALNQHNMASTLTVLKINKAYLSSS